ncbi:MAG: hypothetical protein JWN98_2190 [Abditibacteriota bacterium]|nr:hypothetical protein [Abditibacteriota bacterium]
MPTPAPGAKAPKALFQNESRTHETPHWVQEILNSSAHRTRKKSLPLTWTLIVCASLPFGIWTQSEGISRADSQTQNPVVTSQIVTPQSQQTAPANPVVTNQTAQNQAAPNSLASGTPSSNSSFQPSSDATPSALIEPSQNTAPATAPTNAPTPAPSAAPSLLESARDGVLKLTSPLSKLPVVAAQTYAIRAIVSGQTRNARVTVPLRGASVGEALAEMGITVSPLDRVTPPAKSNAFDGMTVRVTRVAAPLRKRRVAVPFETRYQPTTEIGKGATKVLRAGQAGAVEITERVWMKDGKVSKREFVSRRVARAAQPRIVGLGTHGYYLPGRIPYHNRYARSFSLSARAGSPRDRFTAPSTKTYRAVRSVTLVATGYSPDPRENGGYTVTATGLPIGYGAAAVDPRVIPLGTKMYVEGYGYAFACDVGGAIKGRRIDLAYDSYYLANTKGRKKVRVWILGE